MKKIVLFLGCCLLGWGTTDLLAQQGNVAAGGLATGAGGSASYSIGQMDYLSATGTGGSLIQGLQQPNGGHSLWGTLTYDNASGTVLDNCTVQLKQGPVVVASATTDAAGYYQINNPELGTFHLNALTTKAWGSVNATDALFVLKHFTGIELLSGLKLLASDVDGTSYVNASDALVVMKRFVGLQSSFVVGDWAFEHPSVTITGMGNVTADFKGICFGDVDASYIPPVGKPEPTLFLVNQGIQMMEQYQVVNIPVRVQQAVNPAAMSLIMNYPEAELEILGVQAAYDNQSLVYNAQNGELRIAWCTLQPKNLNADDVLFTLTLKLKKASSDLTIEPDAESNLADFTGTTLLGKSLTMPSLVSTESGFTLSQNMPNPFNGNTQINYTLPENSFVKLELLDIVGKQIAVLSEGQQTSGTHTYTFSGDALADGVYFYRMMVSDGSQQFSQTKRMVISR
ncbi:MAG: T9SS type A sorting domain-containing protein [Bacteroidales bacterium]